MILHYRRIPRITRLAMLDESDSGSGIRDRSLSGGIFGWSVEWYPIGGRVYLGLDPGPRLRSPPTMITVTFKVRF
jgi:hypothetical protein